MQELALRYSEDFVKQAMQSVPHVWSAYRSGDTALFLNLDRIQPGFKPDFEEIKARVAEDWRQDDLQKKLNQRVADLVRQHRVEYPESVGK